MVGEGSTSSKIYVNKGEQYGEMIEISSGIHKSDAVVIKGFNGRGHGKKVEVRNQKNGEVASSP